MSEIKACKLLRNSRQLTPSVLIRLFYLSQVYYFDTETNTFKLRKKFRNASLDLATDLPNTHFTNPE